MRAKNELKVEWRFKKAFTQILKASIDHPDFEDLQFEFDPSRQCLIGKGTQKFWRIEENIPAHIN